MKHQLRKREAGWVKDCGILDREVQNAVMFALLPTAGRLEMVLGELIGSALG